MFVVFILDHVNSLPLYYYLLITLLNLYTLRNNTKLPPTFSNKIQRLFAEKIVYFFRRFGFQDTSSTIFCW